MLKIVEDMSALVIWRVQIAYLTGDQRRLEIARALTPTPVDRALDEPAAA
jgi:ABC-type branched-subunit amino acid transport system ATPase component